MKKLLWIGDAACLSGFARATHEILDTLRHAYDITVLGMNYRGDPESSSDGYQKYYRDGRWPYPIYAAAAEGDGFGIARLIWMCDLVKPDVIVIQNDPWNIPLYLAQLKHFPEYANVPVVAALAVDGKNCAGEGLNGLALAIFWTQFGRNEARAGGYTGEATVIPLGIDAEFYHQLDRYEARSRMLPRALDDVFIVGNVNRNQPRKRWDLTIQYFANWIRSRKVKDAYLYLHTAPTGDTGVNVAQLAKYYGILDRLILMMPQKFYGISEERMRDTYNCFDVQVSTTQGEGFGLTTFEGMACGIPQIVPNWSALGELCYGAAWLVPCTSTTIGPPYVNVIGGVADEEKFIAALQAMYERKDYREINKQAGLEHVADSRFRWATIGQQWLNALAGVFQPKAAEREKERTGPVVLQPLSGPTEEEWIDLGRPVGVGDGC